MADGLTAAGTQLQPDCFRTDTGRYDRQFRNKKELGKSGIGYIFEVEDKDRKKYAVKKISFPKTENAKKLVSREVEALLQLRHEHIVQYHNAWFEDEPNKNTSRAEREGEEKPQMMSLYIQMELCKIQTLRHYLDDPEGSPFHGNRSKQLSIFYQIAVAVQFIHERGLIHGDLKPWSVLFKLDEDTVKIGNFSHTVRQSQENPESSGSSIRGGAKNYMSPERTAKDADPNRKWDIYPMGLMFLELMNPCPRKSAKWTTLMEEAEKLQLPSGFENQNCREAKFILWLLTIDPAERPSIELVLEHTILQEAKRCYEQR